MLLELFGGLTYLLLCGDLLVRGSVALAKRAGISPMVVGLTVVAFGTSAPELFISLGAVFKGHPGVAIGNIVGSNIANVLLVLGAPAILYPTLCNQASLARDTAIMLSATLAFGLLCFLGPIGPVQGGLMFAAMLFLIVRMARRERGEPDAEAAAEQELERGLGLPTRRRMIVLFIGLGAAGLPLGAQLMVDGAVQLARSADVSDATIGLSIVALGTSLPELATTIVAALHRHSDVALGNVLGSNLFNILAIRGITAMVAPQAIPVPPSLLQFDLFVMTGAALILAYFAFTQRTIGRTAGIALVIGYASYLAALFTLSASPAIPAP